MGQPKRHHWWPMVQSNHWTNVEGLVFVTRADGTWFRANPNNIGVESELYTRFGEDGSKDSSIEEWFANVIDDPAAKMIAHLCDKTNRTRRPYKGDPKKAEMSRELGFRTPGYVDLIQLPSDIRSAIARYVAALLVRHPRYLSKLIQYNYSVYHTEREIRDFALDNMKYIFDIYSEKIASSAICVAERLGSSEFLYADGGLFVKEPWERGVTMPFDIHAPLTPDMALEIFPIPDSPARHLDSAFVVETTNQGVWRQNRIMVGSASRFVFSRGTPPSTFIRRYFGVPAPQNIGYRYVNGQFEVRYEPMRT